MDVFVAQFSISLQNISGDLKNSYVVVALKTWETKILKKPYIYVSININEFISHRKKQGSLIIL